MENYLEEDQMDFIGNELNSEKKDWDNIKDELDSENEGKRSSKKEKKSPKEENISLDWSFTPEMNEAFSGRED